MTRSFRVVTYDRRGHSQSERPRGQGNVHLTLDLGRLGSMARPVLFTVGDHSPPTFAPVVAKLAWALPHARVVTLAGAGHIPHVSHPDRYVEAVATHITSGTSQQATHVAG
jgi:pimeloyl-ACP methyl ester carboxylesterase